MGRITFDDIHDVLVEEATEDVMTMAGSANEDLVYSDQHKRIAFFRLPWLLTSLIGAMIAKTVAHNLDHIQNYDFILATYVPVINGLTGNVGSQSAMIVTRGLSIGKIDFRSIKKTLYREVFVAFMLAAIVALIIGAFASWEIQDPKCAIAMMCAILTAMCAAAFIGTTAPMLFKRIGIDPAIAAGPLVTTTCDILATTVFCLGCYRHVDTIKAIALAKRT